MHYNSGGMLYVRTWDPFWSILSISHPGTAQGRIQGSMERGEAQTSTVLFLSQKKVSTQEGSQTFKSGLSWLTWLSTTVPEGCQFCVQFWLKDSTILKRGDLETRSQVKQGFTSKCESGSCFQNPPRSVWPETGYFIS